MKIDIGHKYFYIRPNGIITYAHAKGFRMNDNLCYVQMTKNGLHEWVRTNKVYKTLGKAIKARNSSKMTQELIQNG